MKAKSIIVLLIVAAGVAGVFRLVRSRSAAAEKPEIRTAKVERGTVVESVSATGTLEPLTTVDIKSKAGGRVDVLAVDVGSRVKAGQLIAKIDPTDTLMSVRTARADTDASRARVQQAQDQLSLQKLQNQADLRQAEETLRAARARLAQAQKQAQAQPDLTRSSIAQAQAGCDSATQALRQLETATAPQTRASVQAAYDAAQADVASAQESLRLLQEATAPQERASVRAALDQANANVDIAAKDLQRQKDLRGKGYVAQSVVDQAQNRYDLAVAQAASAKEKMDTMEASQSSDLRSAQHRVSQANAVLASAKRKLETLDADLAAQVSASKARVAQAQAQLDNARGGAVQDELKQDDVAAAQASVQQAEAGLAASRANAMQIGIKTADITSARATETGSRAKLQNAETQYAQTVITAPRDGVVLQKYVEQGTIITSGMSAMAQGTNIVQLGDLSRMFVDVQVDEADIASVEVGQQVDVNVDAFTAEVFQGKVTRIDPQAVTDQNVTTVKVTVEVENADARLKPGMNASCGFIVERAENALHVPSEAVKESDDGTSTVTVVDGDKQVARTVETGITGGDDIEIRSGLKEGETVVTYSSADAAATSSTSRGMPPPPMGGPMGGMPRSGGRR